MYWDICERMRFQYQTCEQILLLKVEKLLKDSN